MEDIIEEEEESKLKKVFIFLIGMFLLLLIGSFVFVRYPIGDIISGQLESKPLISNRIDLGDFSIVFENNSYDVLEALYLKQQKTEFSACLSGNKDNDVYHITSLYQPKIFLQTFNHVSFEPCSEETLIILHTHPYKHCLASQTDLQTLNKTKLRNPEVLMVVMCEPDRFSVYA